FELSPALVAQITQAENLPYSEEQFKKLSEAKQKEWKLVDGTLYRSDDPASPAVGDVRVNFQVVRPTKVSVMAQQHGDSFVAFQPKSASRTIELLHPGEKSAREMVEAEQQANTALTWILRLVGFVMMGLGIFLVLAPMQTFANVLPFLGGLVGMVLVAFSCVCAGVLSTITIVVSWLYYRPLLGIGLLVVAGLGAGVLFWIIRRARRPAVKPG